MRRLWIAMAALALGACSMGADMKIGGDAVAAFHKQLDAGQFAAIEATAGPEMKTSPGQFIQLLDAVHRKLGASGASQQAGFNDAVNPGGHFLTLNYQTTFAKGPATETFVYRIDGGKAVLAGYNINSQALILN